MGNNERPQIGKYILDSLSIGMYNHPLMMIREYIQNSVDAIDAASGESASSEFIGKVDIQVDWRTKSLFISDNGSGVPADVAYSTLKDIGKSLKHVRKHRGFRGIGRLGGLGYCDKLIFRTKFRGEKHYSLSTWDCIRLRRLITEDDNTDIFAAIKAVTSFTQHIYDGNRQDHFFAVEMNNVKSVRDILINVPEIKAYLSQVAPVPFDAKKFSFANNIDAKLREFIPKYETYPISVNDEQVYKPYADEVFVSDKHKDVVRGIDFLELRHEGQLLAYSWIAKTDMMGVIRSNMLVDGLRVRSGNIMIGDKSLMSDLFRERRFNGYQIGEIHAVDDNLIPNSRRDDFEDNPTKEIFLDSFLREIGVPYSAIVRKKSAERATQKKTVSNSVILERARKICRAGYFSKKQRESLLSAIEQINGADDDKTLKELVIKVGNSRHFVDHLNGSLSPQRSRLLKTVIEDIYDLCTNKTEAEEIIARVAKDFQ